MERYSACRIIVSVTRLNQQSLVCFIPALCIMPSSRGSWCLALLFALLRSPINIIANMASTSALRQRMLTGLARRQLLQATPSSSRSISSPAEALSFHPSSKASSSKSVLPGSSNEPATAQAERTLRRFWKSVNLVQDPNDQSWTIQLDKRSGSDFPKLRTTCS